MMIRYRKFTFLGALLLLFGFGSAMAQTDTLAYSQQKPGLRVSLLTCGVGELVYETFGHTALRIVDSSAEAPFNDLIYNYGMFNGYDKNFELKFMRGKLKYYVATEFFGDFMEEYFEYGRRVEEQVLTLNQEQARQLKAYLDGNVKPENRYYKYDFFFDNCATRIRDVFPAVMGSEFVYGKTEAARSRITFRDIMNRYFHRRHWERVGVNILLGSRIDKVMTNSDIMFLPDYLRDGLAAATVSGKPLSTPPQELIPQRLPLPQGPNFAMFLCIGLLALVAVFNGMYAKFHWPARIVNALLLSVSGLLGVLIFVMWFATDHQGCSDNYNILWALPTNLIMAFSRKPGRGRYALIAMMLILVSFVLHFARVQASIPELMVLQAALFVIFAAVYRRSAMATA